MRDGLRYWSEEMPTPDSREANLLHRPMIVSAQRWARSIENENNETWWHYYKILAQEHNEAYKLEVDRDSVLRAALDDRWGNHFMYSGWREVEHFTQLENEKERGKIEE